MDELEFTEWHLQSQQLRSKKKDSRRRDHTDFMAVVSIQMVTLFVGDLPIPIFYSFQFNSVHITHLRV